jgi:putative hydroxymethylpyrimidine transporter CytX
MVSGALLVPALGLRQALLAIIVGSVIGTVPLALVGLAGAREGVPGMVLFRPVLGLRGSYLPSAINLIQLVGWTAFEFWAMGRVANAVARDSIGFDAPFLWLIAVAIVCTGLALGGPILIVRRWLERFGIWVVAAVAVWITVRLLTAGHLGGLWSRPGLGGLPFWAAVDLVIAMPVSWLPLVADFNRFARGERGSAAGTFWSYAAGNAWFYTLGALLVLTAGAAPDVLDIGTTIAATVGGGVVLLALLVGESDQAMANIYSSAMSLQNVRPNLPQRPLILGVGAAGLAIAAVLSDAAGAFEVFLFLIGSVFVPLFGVFAADYFVLSRGRYGEHAMFERVDASVRWRALVPWAVGFVVYQWCVPTGPAWWVDGLDRIVHGALRLPFPLIGGSPLGASVPSFLVAFAMTLFVLRRQPTPAGAESEGDVRG